jgi:hypothetical protein
LQEVGGSAECRAVMFNNWLTTMKDSSGPGVKAQEDPLRDWWPPDFFIFLLFVDVKIIVFRFK